MARLGQIIKKLNIGISTATEFLNKKGEAVEQNPHVQLTENQENLLFKEFSSDKTLKEKSDKLIQKRLERETLATLSVEEEPTAQETKEPVEKEAKTEKKKSKKAEEADELPTATDTVVSSADLTPEEHTEQSRSVEEEKPVKKTAKKSAKAKKTQEDTEADDKTKKVETDNTVSEKEDSVSEADNTDIPRKSSNKKTKLWEATVSAAEEHTVISDKPQQEVDMEQVADKQDMSVENIVVQEEQQYVGVEQEPEIFKFTEQKLEVPKVLGTIDLSLVGKDSRPLPKTKADEEEKRRRAADKDRPYEVCRYYTRISIEDRKYRGERKTQRGLYPYKSAYAART